MRDTIETRIIDSVTGEVKGSVTKLSNFSSLTPTGVKVPAHKHGARAVGFAHYHRDLTHGDLGRIHLITNFLYSDSGFITYKNNRDKIIMMNSQDIYNLIWLCNTSGGNKQLRKLIRCRVIKAYKAAREQFFALNPIYGYNNGGEISEVSFLLFQDEILEASSSTNPFLSDYHIQHLQLLCSYEQNNSEIIMERVAKYIPTKKLVKAITE